MFAIVQSGTQQFTVKEGDKFKVQYIEKEEGSSIELPVLMVSEDDGKKLDIGKPFLDKNKVVADIISHGKMDKVRVFKMIRRHRRRVNKGHRQMYTEIEIKTIK